MICPHCNKIVPAEFMGEHLQLHSQKKKDMNSYKQIKLTKYVKVKLPVMAIQLYVTKHELAEEVIIFEITEQKVWHIHPSEPEDSIPSFGTCNKPMHCSMYVMGESCFKLMPDKTVPKKFRDMYDAWVTDKVLEKL